LAISRYDTYITIKCMNYLKILFVTAFIGGTTFLIQPGEPVEKTKPQPHTSPTPTTTAALNKPSKTTRVTAKNPPQIKTSPTVPVPPQKVVAAQAAPGGVKPVANNPPSTTTKPTTVSEPTPTPLTNAGIFLATNNARVEQGLPKLARNSVLDTIALARLNDMFANQYFAHDSPTGKDVAGLTTVYNYTFRFIGENIAMGGYTSSQAMLDSWMKSPGHRANILSTQYTELGVAVKKGMLNGREVSIGVQVFGKQL